MAMQQQLGMENLMQRARSGRTLWEKGKRPSTQRRPCCATQSRKYLARARLLKKQCRALKAKQRQ